MVLTNLTTALDVKIFRVKVQDLTHLNGEIIVYLYEVRDPEDIKYYTDPEAYMIIAGDREPSKYDIVPFLNGLTGDVVCNIREWYKERRERMGRV